MTTKDKWQAGIEVMEKRMMEAMQGLGGNGKMDERMAKMEKKQEKTKSAMKDLLVLEVADLKKRNGRC